MTSVGRVSEAELHAFVDGELGDVRAMEVAVWIADHPTEGARVDGWRAQNEAIRRAFPAPPHERIAVAFRAPERAPPADAGVPIVNEFRARRERRRAVSVAVSFAAGAVAAAALAVVVQHLATRSRPVAVVHADFVSGTEFLTQRALAAWRAYAEDARHPVEVRAGGRDGLAGWLTARTGLSTLPAIDGARLIGGRVLPGVRANVAFLLYETRDGHRFALLAERGGASVLPPRAEGPIHALGWTADGFDFALAGPVDAQKLRTLAHAPENSAH